MSNIRMSVHRWFNKRDLDAGREFRRCSSCTKARAIEKNVWYEIKKYIYREGLQKKTHKRSERYVQMMHTCWIFLISRCFFCVKKNDWKNWKGDERAASATHFFLTLFFVHFIYIHHGMYARSILQQTARDAERDTTKGE